MAIGIVICILGIIIILGIILKFKKLNKKNRVISFLCGLIIIAIGSINIVYAYNSSINDEKIAYLSLCYLENGYPQQSNYYLKQIKNDKFISVATEVLTEYSRGNINIAYFKLQSLKNFNKKESLTNKIQNFIEINSKDLQNTNVKPLIDEIKSASNLTEKNINQVLMRFYEETNIVPEGLNYEYIQTTQKDEQEKPILLQLNNHLLNQNYESALTLAIQLMEESSSNKNELILAQIIADTTYKNYEYVENAIINNNDKITSEIEKERKKLKKQIDLLQEKLSENKEDYQNKASIQEEIKEFQNKYDYIMVYRALNSIADNHSLQADIVRAKLYYSMHKKDEALEKLFDISNSVKSKVTNNTNLKKAFDLLDKTKKGSDSNININTDSIYDSVETILSYTSNNLPGMLSSELSKDFSNYVQTHVKDYGVNLYVSKIDYSNFPEIVVNISGKEKIIKDIYTNSNIIVKDTRNFVDYTLSLLDNEKTNDDTNIYCVVDESGSMGGAPMDNLKVALMDFVSLSGGKFGIGLIGFEHIASTHTYLTKDISSLNQSIQQLMASGGTDIGAGLSEAVKNFEGVYGEKIVLLMTDGQSNVNKNVLNELQNNNIKVYCIGFGNVSDNMLKEIADYTGGEYIKANREDDLQKIYRSLSNKFGNTIQVKYTVADNVDINKQEGERYFFVQTEDKKISAKETYFINNKNKDVDSMIPKFLGAKTSVISNKQLLSAYNDTIYMNLYFKNSKNIDEILVGNSPVTIESQHILYGENFDNFYVSIKTNQITSGWNGIQVKLNDGNIITYEKAFSVGDEINCRQFKYGNLDINTMFKAPVLLPSGELIFPNDSTISAVSDDENIKAYGSITLSMGYFYIDSSDMDLSNNSEIIIDSSKNIYGNGILNLNFNDSVRKYALNEGVATGEFEISNSDLAKLTTKGEK